MPKSQMTQAKKFDAKKALTDLSTEYKAGDAQKAMTELVSGIDNFESDPKNKKPTGQPRFDVDTH